MTDSELLKSFVDDYQLEVNGVKFWTPYFINLAKSRGNMVGENYKGAFLGKGTPSQLTARLKLLLKAHSDTPKTPHDYRKLMHSNGLGIECSGFLYYVLDNFLKKSGHGPIGRHLFWSREVLLNGYDRKLLWHRPSLGLKRSTIEAYPMWVQMERVQRDFGWLVPRKMVNIRRIVDAQATNWFDHVAELRTGDLIYQVGYDGVDHALLVVEVMPRRIRYAHAGGFDVGVGDPNYFGGVEYCHIDIIDPKLPIEKQKWERQKFLELHTFAPGALRRLKVLDGR